MEKLEQYKKLTKVVIKMSCKERGGYIFEMGYRDCAGNVRVNQDNKQKTSVKQLGGL